MAEGFGHLSSEELTAYLDGVVRPGERGRFEAHLSICERCFDELVAYIRIIRPARDNSGPEPPEPG